MAFDFFGNKEVETRKRAEQEAAAAKTIRALNNPSLEKAANEVATQADRSNLFADIFRGIKSVLAPTPNIKLEELGLSTLELRPTQPEFQPTHEPAALQITVDPDLNTMIVNHRALTFSPLETKFLYELARNETVPTKALAKRIYGADGKRELGALANMISTLRKKLVHHQLNWLIQSDKKYGYSFGDKIHALEVETKEPAKQFEISDAAKKLDRTTIELDLAIKNKRLAEGKHFIKKGKNTFFLTLEGISFIKEGNLDKVYLKTAAEMSKNWNLVTPWTKQEEVALAGALLGLQTKSTALSNRGITIDANIMNNLQTASQSISDEYRNAVAQFNTNAELAEYLGCSIFYRADVTKAFFKAKLQALAKNPHEARIKRFGNRSDKGHHYNELVSGFLGVIEQIPGDKKNAFMEIITSIPSVAYTTNREGWVITEREEN